MKKRFLFFLLFAVPVQSRATTYYISPNGNNANDGLSAANAKKTFANVFGAMSAADELIVMSTAALTTYATASTGYMSWDDGSCSNCAQPPSGTSAGARTVVRSTDTTKTIYINSGGTRHALFIGRSTRKDAFIKIQGLTFEGGGVLYNTKEIYIKDCGFHATRKDGDDVFGVGTNDGNWTNVNNLIEDCWIWGQDRIIATNYRASHNIWRRVFVRGDGCNTAACTGSGNPNVGITVYNSSNVSVQNVMVVDRILGGGEPYADFAQAQHAAGGVDLGSQEYNKQNEWLGCLSLNSGDHANNFECNGCTSPSTKMIDFAAIHPAGGGVNIGAAQTGLVVENVTVLGVTASGEDAFRIAPGLTGFSVKNIVVSTAARYGVNSAIQPSYVDVFNAGTNYNNTTCAVGCLTSDPRGGASPAIKYVTRIESGSSLSGTGSGGADYGANLLYQYGSDGVFAGAASSNTLSGNSLWPWPNQARIKSEVCSGNSTAWCGTAKTLTEYIWDFLGRTDGPYGSTGNGGGSTYTNVPRARANGQFSFKNIRFR